MFSVIFYKITFPTKKQRIDHALLQALPASHGPFFKAPIVAGANTSQRKAGIATRQAWATALPSGPPRRDRRNPLPVGPADDVATFPYNLKRPTIFLNSADIANSDSALESTCELLSEIPVAA